MNCTLDSGWDLDTVLYLTLCLMNQQPSAMLRAGLRWTDYDA
jgi:predicted component of type VI protein secretion system